MSSRALVAVAVAVLAVSWGAPLARMTAAAPLAVAFWRMAFAALLTGGVSAGLTLAGRERPLPGGARRAAWLAGGFLGLHFGLWIPSLFLTSVSASVVLVTTQPLWVLLASPRLLGAPIRRRNLASLALAFTGVVIIAGGDVLLSWRALAGDLLALGGAVAMAAYMVIGRRLRAAPGGVPLQRYLTAVYGMAALTLLAAVALLRVPPLARDGASWLYLLAMAAGPTMVGHTLLNWALAHVEAYKVNLAVLLEPVLASLWVWLLLAEAPPGHVVPGAALIIAALALEYWPAAPRADRQPIVA